MVSKKNNSEEEKAGDEITPVERVSILPTSIAKEMRESYIDYAMSVITTRALPDIRDGLKPVHRRILFAMHKNGVTFAAKPNKSARIVGDVIGKYHPHGDTAVYEAMVKLTQDFSTRYPLVIGQGNFGSIDGDSAAAMRYTEAKMSRLSGELLADLEKDTVDFRSNYDGREREPSVLPAAVPLILLNGTLGIAVGMATKIAPHNLGEIVDATNHLIENPTATTEDLFQFVKGPDFPLGGVAFADEGLRNAFTTGKGGIVVRGEAEIIESKGDQFQIIITSIPYQVLKSSLIENIADLVRDKKLEGIRGLRDESTRDIRVVIELKTGVHPQKVLNFLYKHTELESTFHYNMIAIVDGTPQTLSLKSILTEFIKHRNIVVIRRTQFDLNKAQAREHILLGLKKALDHIDEIIKLIRASKDTPEAHANLVKKFSFSDLQATAILEMKLQRLAGLERKKIEDELSEIQKLIEKLKDLLASPKKILKVISDELLAIKEKYGDARRTKIISGPVKNLTAEDLIPDTESVLVYTSGGYVKRTDPLEYRSQKRGGVGVVDLDTKDEDFVTILLNTSTHSDLLFFTDKGKAYQIKMYDLPEGRRATRGKSIMNFLQIEAGEKITSILPMPKEIKSESLFLLMVTKNGTVKKSSADNFKDVRRNGLIAIRLEDGDELLSAMFTKAGDDVICATREGQSIRFGESDIREMGRTAAGVIGMKLSKGDYLINADVISEKMNNPQFLVMSENGYGKKTPLDEYKTQKRGGSGIKTMNLTDKTGKLAIGKVVTDDMVELIAMSKKSQVLKTELNTIPSLSRSTQGVRIIKPREGDELASLTCI
jgi:DNA gyrase subunit A